MAYMNQTKKKEIKKVLDEIVPKGWKYSLRVRNYSKICFSLMKSPPLRVLYLSEGQNRWQYSSCDLKEKKTKTGDYISINENCLEHYFPCESYELDFFKKVRDVLNTGNYDNSNVQEDYFDVGHYISISIGQCDKPYEALEISGGEKCQ